MHFHVPKPMHGWREFLGEIGIIVIGVLIALGAEQLVEAWQWRQKVDVVRKSLIRELANDRGRWDVDLANTRCAMQTIGRLDLWAERSDGTEPPIAPGARPANFFWMHSANWNLATASQTLDHFPMDEQLAFAALYDGIAHSQRYIESAADLNDRVPDLTGLAVDAQGRHELQLTLAGLKGKLRVMLDNAAYMKRHFNALGVKPDHSDFAEEFTGKTCSS